MTKLLGMYCGIVAATAVLSAQTPTTPTTPSTSSSQPTTTTESGQPMTITGCISPDTISNSGASTMTNQRFILSNVQPPVGATTAAQSGSTTVTTSYMLAPGADVNLSQHLNHKVQITGTVDSSRTTRSSSSSTSPSTTNPSATSSSTQSSTASAPTFRVTSVKMLSETCP